MPIITIIAFVRYFVGLSAQATGWQLLIVFISCLELERSSWLNFIFTSVSYRICSLSFHLYFLLATMPYWPLGPDRVILMGQQMTEGCFFPANGTILFLELISIPIPSFFFQLSFSRLPFLVFISLVLASRIFTILLRCLWCWFKSIALETDSRILSQRIIHLVEHTCLPWRLEKITRQFHFYGNS